MSSHVLPERSHVCITSSYPELQKARARAVKLLNWAIFIYVITMYYVLCTIPTQPRTHARTHRFLPGDLLPSNLARVRVLSSRKIF